VREHRYAVYIMASRSHNFYVGVTNNIARRVREHKNHTFDGFTARYHVDRLAWYHIFGDIRDAITREKQLKHWRREKKIRLIDESDVAGLVRRMGNADYVEGDYSQAGVTADPSARAEALGRDDKMKV
jgi:putative endonuclease